tara:strand:- start:679 stop:786 length:108 start_codon:yes stop_codon:yes gene_type:complete
MKAEKDRDYSDLLDIPEGAEEEADEFYDDLLKNTM